MISRYEIAREHQNGPIRLYKMKIIQIRTRLTEVCVRMYFSIDITYEFILAARIIQQAAYKSPKYRFSVALLEKNTFAHIPSKNYMNYQHDVYNQTEQIMML